MNGRSENGDRACHERMPTPPDSSSLPGYPPEWDPLVDGPLDSDGDFARQLWRDWEAAENEGNEWAARWAWDRYERWMTGKGSIPVPTGPIEPTPFVEVLAGIRSHAEREGRLETEALASAVIDAEMEAKPSKPTPAMQYLADIYEMHRREWRHIRATALWWVQYGEDAGWVSVCSECVERDDDGHVPHRASLQPVGPRSVGDLVDHCRDCGRTP